jgi:hypothetical protein
LADALRNRDFCQDFTRLHSIAWVRVRALLLRSRQCWDARSGVNSTSRIDCRCPFCSCYRCCRLITMELYTSGQFGFIDDPDRQLGNGSVWNRTRT